MVAQADPAPASTLPVADLDWCDSCGDLVRHDVCRSCGRREDLVEQARVRPSMVLVQIGDHENEDLSDSTAVLRVPVTASESAKHVAEAAALIATERLLTGWSLEIALGRLALGRDDVRRTLEQSFGISLSRNTVAAALQELHDLGVLPRVGRLGSWVDRKAEGDWPKKLGAYVYRLNVVLRGVGEIALSAISRVRRRSNATVRSTGYGARVDGALRWAVEHAEIGTRNVTGCWLAWRSRKVGLSEVDTMKVMTIYRAQVPAGPRDGYGREEVERTVRSQYRRFAHGRV